MLGEVLVELRLCSEDQIVETLAQAYGVPYARVSPRVCDPKIIATLPREFLEKHQVLPLFLVEGVLTVAIPEPANVFLLEEIERVGGHPAQVVAATAHDIRATLQTYMPDESVFVIDDIIDEVKFEEFTLIEDKTTDISNLEQAAGDSPVIKLVNYCIYNAVKDGASDIHIEPGDHILRMRYRIDGRLVEKLRPPFQMHPAVVSRIKIMAGIDIAERRLPQDGAIHVLMDKRPIDLRVSTMPGKFGEKVVIRVIDNDKASVNLERVGFSYDTLKQWRKLISLPNGILLVTGPTGSGKSTTLYASLAELNDPEVNICTVEDPIEYNLAGINQFQVSDKSGLYLCQRAASAVPPGPRHRDGGRGARSGHGQDCHSGRADGPPRLEHPSHQRRSRRDYPSVQPWHRAVSRRRHTLRSARTAAGPQALSGMPGALCSVHQRAAADGKSGGADRNAVSAKGMYALPQHWLPWPDWDLRTARA